MMPKLDSIIVELTKDELELIDGALELLLTNTEIIDSGMPNHELEPFLDMVYDLKQKWENLLKTCNGVKAKYN